MRALTWGCLLSVLLNQCYLVSHCLGLPVASDCYQVKARGQEIGYLTIRSFRQPQSRGEDRIVTEMENINHLSRLGDGFTTGSQSRFIERASDARPLSFTYRTVLSGKETAAAEGEIQGKSVTVQLHQSMQEHRETTRLQETEFSFPTGERIRQLFKAHYQDPVGSSFGFQTLHLAIAPQVVKAQAQVGETENLQLSDKTKKTVRRFTLLSPDNPANRVYEWRDAEGKLYKAYSDRQQTELVYLPQEAYGQQMKLAGSAPSSLDTIASTRIRSNESIRNPRHVQEALYRLTVASGKETAQVEGFHLPEDTRQMILQESPGQGILLKVSSHEPQDAMTPYPISFEKRYLQSSPYLQSEDPELVTLARRIVEKEPRAYFAARKLQQWVYEHIAQKDLSQGFASAKETLTQKTGDCTEHAVLLAALARAVGIPARVAVGVLYLPEERNSPGYFTYHLWTEVYTGKEWTALDASNAETQVDATHIKLSDSDLADANAPVALAESLSDLFFRLRIDVLQATAPGATLVSLSGKNGEPLSLSGSNTLRWDLRDFQQKTLETYRLDALQGLQEKSIEGLLTTGFQHLLAGKSDAAREVLQQALRQAKGALECYHLGERFAGLELFDLANQAFDQAVQRDPTFTQFVLAWRQYYFPATLLSETQENEYFQAIGLEVIQQDPERARSLYQTILSEKPGFSPIELRLARMAMAQKDYPTAFEAFQRFSRLAPKDPRGPEGQAQAALALGQYPQALERFQMALQLAERQASLQGKLLAEDLGIQLQRAQGLARLAKSSEDPVGWQLIGHVLLRQNRYEDALAATNQALRLKPYEADAMVDKLETLIALSQWEGLSGFTKVLQTKTVGLNQARVEQLLGYLAMRQRQYGVAKTHLLKAIALNPKEPKAYEILAQVYQRLGELPAAQALLRRGVNQLGSSQTLGLRFRLAQLMKRENPQEAQRLLEGVIRENPIQVQPYVEMASLWLAQNRLSEAKAAAWNALTIDPYEADALAILGDCYALEENPNEALYDYRKALKASPGNVKANQSLELLIEQFQLNMKRPVVGFQLNEDEGDYLRQLKGQSEALEAMNQRFKTSMNSVIGVEENFLERKAEVLPVLEVLYRKLSAQYQEARRIRPPARLRALHEKYVLALYGKTALLHDAYDWLNGLTAAANFSDFKQEPAFQTYLQAKTLIDEYRNQYQGLIKRLDPTLAKQYTLSDPES